MRRLFLAAALLAAMVVPATASAAPHSPTGEYAPFANCPLSRPTLNACLYAQTTSGYFTLGKKTTPIKNPVVLQAGIEWPNEEGIVSPNLQVFPAEDGNTLTKTPQPVPGGLLGIQAPAWWPSILRNLFNETINNGFTGVTATMELAAPASAIKLDVNNIASGQGTALQLPVKVKLSNPFLGNNCYIGSSSQPIVLKLITGTTSPPPPNQPITGSPGEFSQNADGSILTLNKNRLVDNSFAAPGANGCGGLFSFLVDPFVNSIIGLPSPAGTNTAVLEGKTQIGAPEPIRASEP
jgi:hypothetical protein